MFSSILPICVQWNLLVVGQLDTFCLFLPDILLVWVVLLFVSCILMIMIFFDILQFVFSRLYQRLHDFRLQSTPSCFYCHILLFAFRLFCHRWFVARVHCAESGEESTETESVYSLKCHISQEVNHLHEGLKHVSLIWTSFTINSIIIVLPMIITVFLIFSVMGLSTWACCALHMHFLSHYV